MNKVESDIQMISGTDYSLFNNHEFTQQIFSSLDRKRANEDEKVQNYIKSWTPEEHKKYTKEAIDNHIATLSDRDRSIAEKLRVLNEIDGIMSLMQAFLVITCYIPYIIIKTIFVKCIYGPYPL